MKVACITTTVNVPTVLRLYAKFGPSVMFFVAGDKKTPDQQVVACLETFSHAYYGIDMQHRLGYTCSRLIGDNCIQRRNIMLLEAMKWGADIIVTIDDDNIPLVPDYFNFIKNTFNWSSSKYDPVLFQGLQATSPTGWFDAGHLLLPKIPHRGFPHDKKAEPIYQPAIDVQVGVIAGLCLGDADMDAATRIVNGPIAQTVSELGRTGVVTDPRQTWTVFNTQNTAFLAALAPAMFCAPGLGRFDDIYASLITQRLMRERGLHVRFGHPFVWQQRNSHKLLDDLAAEVDGMLGIVGFAQRLAEAPVDTKVSVVENCRQLWKRLGHSAYLPSRSTDCALAFLDDCDAVLKARA